MSTHPLTPSECDLIKTILVLSAVIGGGYSPFSPKVSLAKPAGEKVQLDDNGDKNAGCLPT